MNISRESLLDDFSTMLTEAEDLLKRAGNETGERAKDLRAQVEAKLLSAKLRLQELEGEAMDRAQGRGALHRRLTCTTIRGARSASPRSSGSSSAC